MKLVRLLDFWSFGLGFGLIPYAPGTFGSLLALPIGYVILGHHYAWVVWVLLVGLSTYACAHTMKSLGQHDPKQVVSDEVVGLLLLILLVQPESLWAWCSCFMLFRFFDILKPWPINWVDKHVKTAFGVMLDDLLAALVSFAVYLLVVKLI